MDFMVGIEYCLRMSILKFSFIGQQHFGSSVRHYIKWQFNPTSMLWFHAGLWTTASSCHVNQSSCKLLILMSSQIGGLYTQFAFGFFLIIYLILYHVSYNAIYHLGWFCIHIFMRPTMYLPGNERICWDKRHRSISSVDHVTCKINKCISCGYNRDATKF